MALLQKVVVLTEITLQLTAFLLLKIYFIASAIHHQVHICIWIICSEKHHRILRFYFAAFLSMSKDALESQQKNMVLYSS